MSHASTNNKQKTNSVNVELLWKTLREKLGAQSSILAMKLDDVLKMEQTLMLKTGSAAVSTSPKPPCSIILRASR